MQNSFTLLVFLSLSFNSVFGQNPEIVRTVIPQRNQDFTVSVEHLNDFREHCKTPLQYIIRKTGSVNKNTKIEWTFQYVPCGKTSPIKQTVSFLIPKGVGTITKEIPVHSLNIITRYDDNSLTIKTIEDPPFTINGPKSVLEGGVVNLNVEAPNAGKQVKWIWAKGSTRNIVSTANAIRDVLYSTTKFYVCSENEGFRSDFKEYIVNVILRPDPPSDFKIIGPAEITDIQSADLSIQTNSVLEDVQWIWQVNNQKVGEGLSISVSPNTTTTYSVYSEYYGKRSLSKSFQVKVNVLPEPPSDFNIIGPDRIYEGEKIVLRIANKGNDSKVKWTWTNSKDETKTVADSIIVSLYETAIYKLYADLNGKLSVVKNKTIEVVQRAVAPSVIGNFKRCITETTQSRFTLSSGKLGTGAKSWNWYEGVCGSGRMIGTGVEISLSPSKTTSYYVQPDNNAQVCKQFTIEVGQMPPLPDKLISNEIACPNTVITLEALGYIDTSARWIWYAKKLNETVPQYKGEGRKLVDTLKNTTVYYVRSTNRYCQSKEERTIKVQMKDVSLAPNDVLAYQIKRKQYLVKVIGKGLASGSQWVWYKDACNALPLGYGAELRYKASRNNHLFVRAEGMCDTTSCKVLDFQYKKRKSRFLFLNAGLSANNVDNKIIDYNGLITLGSNSLYLRATIPISHLQSSQEKENLMDVGVELETTNAKVTNYPLNTSTYYTYNGKTRNECYNVSGGFLFGGNVIRFYMGGGYGKRDLYWGVDIFDYGTTRLLGSTRARNVSQGVSGPLAEGGIFLKLGSLNLMGGVSTVIGSDSNLYKDINLSIGFNINKTSK